MGLVTIKHMKTITWSEFISLCDKTNIIKVDNIEVCIHTNKDTVKISWEDNGEEWHFTFEEDKNEKIEVKDNSAVVFCNEYDVDAFNFEFFNLIPVAI